ncbi:MAG: TrkH family potassium uptake protein [Epsilonproteobacteria bacterium]|nr:TrkH family potassium uptake protein [Campylobacterota bacterium]
MFLNIGLILSIISVYLMLLGALETVPLAVSLIYHESIAVLAESIGITLGSGALLYIIAKIFRNEQKELRYREGFLVVTLIWLVSAFFYGLPFTISGVLPNIVDSYFEAMSGFTTTGATVIDNLSNLSHGLLFLRSYTQWLGGMGIIVLAVAIFPFSGASGVQLFSAESSGITLTKIKPRIKETALSLWIIYFVLTLVEIVLLMLGGMNPFDAVITSLSTLPTGGFSNYNSNIGHFHSSYIRLIIIFFMILGGMQFTLLYNIIKNPKDAVKKNYLKGETNVYLFIIIVSSFLIFVSNKIDFSSYSTIFQSYLASLFTTVSQMTSTGFTAYNYGSWTIFSQLLLVSIMVIGAMAGSTGGGIKVIRFIVIYKAIKVELYKMIHPSLVKEVKIPGYEMTQAIVRNTLVFFGIYLFAVIISSLILTFFNIDIVTAISATIASLSNAGPGLGGVAPPNTYSFFSTIPKIVLTFDMLIGRLEFYTVMVIFLAIFWKR